MIFYIIFVVSPVGVTVAVVTNVPFNVIFPLTMVVVNNGEVSVTIISSIDKFNKYI
tara:strand:- start:5809 stop:5976 length:168 start_codon:yes stop_codon:yes gene_type:complete